MSHRVTMTLSDAHFDWLNTVRINRGWDNVGQAIKSLIEDDFRENNPENHKKVTVKQNESVMISPEVQNKPAIPAT